MMSAPGEREQILGRALGREGTARAPVPTAAETPRPPAGSSLPGQPSPTACPHPRSCRGSGAGQGHRQPPPHSTTAGGITVNRKPHPSRRLMRQRAVLAAGCPRSPWSPPGAGPVPGCWRMGPGWQEVSAAPVMLLLLVLSAWFREATSLIKIN